MIWYNDSCICMGKSLMKNQQRSSKFLQNNFLSFQLFIFSHTVRAANTNKIPAFQQMKERWINNNNKYFLKLCCSCHLHTLLLYTVYHLINDFLKCTLIIIIFVRIIIIKRLTQVLNGVWIGICI